VAFLLLIVIAAYTDIAYGKVYNWLTVPAILLGFACSYVLFDLEGIKVSFLGFGVGGGVFLIFFAKGWIGAGDVKLVAAIGALQGWQFVLYAIFLGSCVGAAMAVALFIWQGRFLEGIGGSLLLIVSPKRFKKKYSDPPKMPYGLAVSIGGLWAWILLSVQELPSVLSFYRGP